MTSWVISYDIRTSGTLKELSPNPLIRLAPSREYNAIKEKPVMFRTKGRNRINKNTLKPVSKIVCGIL